MGKLYDYSGTAAVVGGILFSSGIAARAHFEPDDTVHWLSWVGLGLIAVGMVFSVGVAIFEIFNTDDNKMKKALAMLVGASFAGLVIALLVLNAEDHDAVSIPNCADGKTDTMLKGPAILEIGSAGIPALDAFAAFVFMLTVMAGLWKMIYDDDGNTDLEGNVKTLAVGSYWLTFCLLIAALVLVIIISAKIGEDDPWDVIGDLPLQKDIKNYRIAIYAVYAVASGFGSLTAYLASGQSGNGRLTVLAAQTEEGRYGWIGLLHMVISVICTSFVFIGCFVLAISTDGFWKDTHGMGSFAPGPLCHSESSHTTAALGNTFFGFFLPLALSMSWYAYRPGKE